MSKPKGSAVLALSICALVVISVGSIGYYQFMYCQPSTCVNIMHSSSATATCAAPSCVIVSIEPGAATLTTTAFSPDQILLVIGVNNSVQFYNNDSQSGGVAHTATDHGTPQAFDTGTLAFGASSGIITISKPGTYNYYCVIHPSTMIGSIVVKAA